MADIVICEFMDQAPLERFRPRYSVLADDTLWERRADLQAALADAAALILRNRCHVDAALLVGAPRLAVIGRLGVGLDNIDLDACRARGIEVCAALGANSIAVAEYVIAAALTLLRGDAYGATARLLAGEWPRQELGGGRELAGRTFGIVGMGLSGQATAGKAKALGLNVVAYSPNLPADHPAWHETEAVSLAVLLARSDIVSLHCPLTPATRGMIGAAEIAAMKRGAILINSARGGIASEAAIAAALRSGQLRGAALDVFETEPLGEEARALLTGVPNLLLTPHIAGLTMESNARTSAITVDNVLAALQRKGL